MGIRQTPRPEVRVDGPRGGPPYSVFVIVRSPNAVRIRLRHADLGTFIEKFAPNVTRGGVFLATRNQHPVGSTIGFEIQLATGQVALAGEGTVTWVREWHADEPHRAHGMGVRFTSIEAATRPVLASLLRAKEAGGGGPAARQPNGSVPALADSSGANGRLSPAPPRVDTGVDLAAELGVDPAAVRSLIERTWMTSARSDEDLTELLTPSTAEPSSLAQALSELPRFLDRASGRRRSTTGARPLDSERSGATRTAVEPATPARAAIPAHRDNEITDMTALGQPSADAGVSAPPPFVEAIHESTSSKRQHQ